ncbi:hypothetical protein [Neisseria zalophi]|uniref:Uncharacterized protein n=1 Tax=Neisseria zalophi TaxID=640030 RepID=A0A5J6PUM0_9NEIS|nr:hypothetical protein [Neisseria zalophi]QEY26235.1 hypothetical protein D0T92_06660 [Neisseria zalophi]
MKILNNNELNKKLYNLGLCIDDLQNINFLNKNQYPTSSILNQEYDARALIAISNNIIGWLSENPNSSFIYFKLSYLSYMPNENKFFLTKLLTYPFEQNINNLVLKLNSEILYHNVYQFKILSDIKEEQIFEKITLQQIINYLLTQEEHGNFISISNNEFRLISIQDGLISITSNNYSYINRKTITELLDYKNTKYRSWLPD